MARTEHFVALSECHLMNDQALAEMCRVTRTGGRVAALGFAGEEQNPLFGIPQGIARRIGGLPEPRPGTPWQFSLGDPQRLGDLFRASGLRDVEVHRATSVRRFASAGEALRRMQEASLHTREWMSRLTEAQREQAWQDTERELYRFEGPNGCELLDESLRCRTEGRPHCELAAPCICSCHEQARQVCAGDQQDQTDGDL